MPGVGQGFGRVAGEKIIGGRRQVAGPLGIDGEAEREVGLAAAAAGAAVIDGTADGTGQGHQGRTFRISAMTARVRWASASRASKSASVRVASSMRALALASFPNAGIGVMS